MQVVQQKQPLFNQVKIPLIINSIKAGAAILLVTISIVASFILQTAVPALAATLALNMALAICIKDKWVVRLLAVALTMTIVSISLAVLFPVTIPFVIPIMGFTTSLSFSYAALKLIKV